MEQPLTKEEMDKLDKALRNLSIAYWKQLYIPVFGTKVMRNHVLSREMIKRAYEQIKEIVEKW